MLKITIIKNRVEGNVDDDIQEVKNYFFANLPLKIEWTVLTANLDVQFEQTKLATGGTVWAIKPIPFPGDIVVFIYGNRPPDYTTACTKGTYCQVPFVEAADSIGWHWKAIAHEILHAICNKINTPTWRVKDEMDFTIFEGKVVLYKDNDNPYAPDGNFAHTIENLLPFLHDGVTITRSPSTKKETLGVLTAVKNGKVFSAKTLELPWLDNKPQVSCIPKGTYQVTWSFSPRKMKYTYRVMNVPNRSGILFHSANYFTDLLGCIALGDMFSDINHDGQLDVINSRKTIQQFEDFMERKSFTLKIV